ncbi:hypothetical protein [Sporohalobacter salinus]|uniref:hypothetical protein n=1 Tax=Sporohalobacter salinus TaxID=1494606 RepID=UPI00195F4B8D|nr:hypothetical protein [Sporohalobacter salinus]MBM7624453.1 hypothetical protein [Sporohalobacter salinus]
MGWLDRLKSIFKIESKSKDKLTKLNKRLEKIEAIIEKISDETLECQITIEKLNVDNPQLDDLTFSLKELNVEELGGALNLGNNFGVEVIKDEEKKKNKNKTKQKNSRTNFKAKEQKKNYDQESTEPKINKKFTKK